MTRLAALRERLRTSLWFIPGIFAFGALVGGLVMVELDRLLQFERSAFYLYGGTPEGARSVLSTIATSMLTFTGLVFTVTMLVLQLASSQLSPRVLRTFLADRQNQVVLGLFVATFIFTLVVLRTVRAADSGEEFVPAISIWIALVLLGASVGAFILYINHMAHAIRASTVIANIAEDTRHAIERVYGERGRARQGDDAGASSPAGDVDGADDGDWLVLEATDGGSLTAIDEGALFEAAKELSALIVVVPQIGDFVPRTTPLVRVRTHSVDDRLADRVRRAISLGRERTMQQDPAFGFRQLLDIAARALSPGTNDPTTAVQVIDALHDLLLQLATCSIGPTVRLTDDGRAGIVVGEPTWDDFVHLAVDELRLYGAPHLQVVRRLHRMLASLAEQVPEDRRQVVYSELDRLRRSVEESIELRSFDRLPTR